MSIVTLDFETYYDKDFSLGKLTTEEYINDPRFEVIGVGIKINDGESKWYSGTDVESALEGLDWPEHALLCHNTMFDGAILAFKYRIIPGFYLDTLCMARAIHGVEAGGSLKALASKYQIGEKGDEVINALGKRLGDFSAGDLHNYGMYCRNDVALTRRLFDILATDFPDSELKLIDLTLRMYTQPVLMVDDALLIERLDKVRADKQAMLATLKDQLKCDDEEEVRKKLASNKQFAELLAWLGVEAPMKTSPTTGKQTLALAKTDEGFIALSEHDNPLVQQLCAVRLGTKSTLEESRIERFLDIGARNKARLPIPLKYYGAHTGRWSGMDLVNFQNLPSRDKAKKSLKNSIVAPPSHVVINCDSSQIEARVLAWLTGQNDVVQQFASGEDVYSTFATKIYNRPISKDTPVERFVGKTCVLGLGYGTGAKKLQHTLKTQPPGADLTDDECQRIVSIYRGSNDKITAFWRECDVALKAMMAGQSKPVPLGNGCIKYLTGAIQLPNNLFIRYAKLRIDGEKVVYDSRKGPVNIWGGAMTENIVQALARIIVSHQMIKINEGGYRPVLTVHDSVVCVVREDSVKDALEYIINVMSTPPDWAKGLPVACEAKYGKSYGEC